MAKLIAARSAQYPLAAEFTFNFDDTMTNVAGTTLDFGAANTAATTVSIIPLPVGATVLGGSIRRDVAFDAATFNVTVGDATTADRYLASTDVKAVGITALVPTGYTHATGEDLRLTFTAADVCTTGKATVRIEYTIAGRANENTLT